MDKRKITKREVSDLVAYSTVLIHNNAIDEVMSVEEIDKMMTKFIESFNQDEEKTLKYFQERVSKLKQKLVN